MGATDSSPIKSLSLRDIRHVVLDMDGTIYRGNTLFDFTLPFLRLLNDLRFGYTFVTNNPSRSVDDYLAHLHHLGLPVAREQLYTSTEATIQYLREQWPKLKKLFVLGTASMCEEFAANGF